MYGTPEEKVEYQKAIKNSFHKKESKGIKKERGVQVLMIN